MSISKLKKVLTQSNGFLYKHFLSPIVKIEDKKNYIRIFGINFLFYKMPTKTFKYAIYIDNEDEAFVLQLEKWFLNDFFKKEEVLIVIRNYKLIKNSIIEYLETQGYNFYIYRIIRNFDISIFEIKYIFYIFNSFTNPVVIKDRTFKHIWIGHGESDKLASVNPMIKMYDYIFVAGDIAIKRLLAFNIINRCDIDSGKVIKIGLPYLKPVKVKKKSNKIKKILYAPTWEGIEKEQQYSSLNNNFGLKIINDFLINYNDNDIELYFQPHPSTGIKDSTYITYINNFIEKFQKYKDFYVLVSENSFVFGKIKTDRILNSTNEYSEFDFVFTDNSSIIANLIFYKVNYLVLLDKKNMNLKKSFLLSISSIVRDKKELIDIVSMELKVDKDKRYLQVVNKENLTLEDIILYLKDS